MSGALFRFSFVKSIESILQQSSHTFDWIAMLEASRTGQVLYHPRPLLYYRSTSSVARIAKPVSPYKQILERYREYLIGKGDEETAALIQQRILECSSVQQIDSATDVQDIFQHRNRRLRILAAKINLVWNVRRVIG